MTHKKTKRGGVRKGSGRKQKYNESTSIVGFRCPKSKIAEFTDHCNQKLQTWIVKK